MSLGPRTLVVVLVLVLLAGFAVLNWSAVTTPVSLDFLVGRVEAPLGLTLLGVVGALTLLYGLMALSLETRALLGERRQARELETQRRLAEDAEASRYAELRRYLEEEVSGLRTLPAESTRTVVERLDRIEETLRTEIERAGNSLAAYIGELEDRLVRGGEARPAEGG